MELLPFIFRAILFFLIIYFIIWPLYAAYRFTHPSRVRVAYFTPTNLGVEYEDVTLRATDGVDLVGWYMPSRNGAAIILLHGLGSNRLMMVEYAEALLKAGYGVLLFDLRAHGDSGGKSFARSQQGVDDVLTAVAYLTHRPDVNAAGVGVVGLSIGGLFALQSAAQTVAIRAVLADGASPAVYADIPPPVTLWERVQYGIQRLYMKAADWFTGQAPLPANLTILPRIAPRPVFLISTGAGGEQRMVQGYYEATQDVKRLWEIPKSRHAEGWRVQPGEYERYLISFFDQALAIQSGRRIFLPESTTENGRSQDQP